MELLSVLVGWLLGLLSQPIVSRIEKRYKNGDYKKVILSEFKNLTTRLVATCYQIQGHLGIGGKENLLWVKNKYEQCREDCPENVMNAINKILNAPDDQFEMLVQATKAPEGMGLHLKTFALPFVDSILGDLFVFDAKLQQKILDIHAQVNMLNEEIEKANDCHRLTFEDAYKEPNASIIRTNIKNSYFEIQKRCRIVVNKIDTVLVKK